MQYTTEQQAIFNHDPSHLQGHPLLILKGAGHRS